jgi:hypothetical protein
MKPINLAGGMDRRILDIDGWMGEEELEWLYARAREIQKGCIVEVGAWLGRSTAALYTGAGENVCVVTIDTWQGQASLRDTDHHLAQEIDLQAAFMANMEVFGIIPKPFIDLETPGRYYLSLPSLDAAVLLPDRSVDMCFVDGDHDIVAADIGAYKPKVKPGGLLCAHDYWLLTDAINGVSGNPDGVCGSIFYKTLP